MPLELSLTDPRGIEILRKKFGVSQSGFEDFSWSSEGARSGTYSLGIYLIRGQKQEQQFLLGSTSFRVDEFQPDKLAVKVKFSEAVELKRAIPSGWADPNGGFKVQVQNLFGTPAVDNKVIGTLLLRPWDGIFPQFSDYSFYQREDRVELPTEAESLGERNTDSEGVVSFDAGLNRFAETAFQVEFAAEAFEKESGRSVVATSKTLVSSAPFFLGWRSDGDLGYISKGVGRKISFIALDPYLKPVELKELKMELIQTQSISALVRQPNGTLSYQMTPKKSSIWTNGLTVGQTGTEYLLKTDQAGDFTLVISDSSGRVLNRIPYIVLGEGSSTFLAERKAEVGIKLSQSSVEPDQEIEVAINTPYVGAGVITVEREKVYSVQWFKTDNLSTVQRLRVPRGVVGNAYISVAFVRSLESKDIFASPLCYGVKPFFIARSEYTESVKLTMPPKVKPGETLRVGYELKNPSDLMLYAVDEGILQFARYKNPQPVEKFIPKRALEVETMQILDLLLPDQRIVDSVSSVGGDEDVGLGKFKNPFGRKRRPPMAFWSGVISAKSNRGEVEIPVPDYFNGEIRVIALAVGEKRVGVEVGKVVSQADFVIDPQAPYFVSPGDEFEVGATVANTVAGSGSSVKVVGELVIDDAFELLGAKDVEFDIPEGQDRVFRIKLRAKAVLGDHSFQIRVKGLEREVSAAESISVRAPYPYRTSISAGLYRPDKDGDESRKELKITRELYSEKRDVSASISFSPLGVGRALVSYLRSYPYGCTEQLVSSAFPSILFGADQEMGLSEQDVNRFTKRAFQSLSSRQRADGDFGYWDPLSSPNPIFSVYGVHFLVEAKERGFDVPVSPLERSVSWLKSLGQKRVYTVEEHFAQAYALYLRGRMGEVVTKELESLVADLQRNWGDKWRKSVIALFVAGTYKMMQMDDAAFKYINRPPEVWGAQLTWPANDAALFGSIYAWISAAHFPESTWLSPLDTVLPVARMIEDRDFNSFRAAFALIGLEATARRLSLSESKTLEIAAIGQEGAINPLQLSGVRVFRSAVDDSAGAVIFSGKAGRMFFYELSETGFDRNDVEPITAGLRIDRQIKGANGELKTDFALEDKAAVTLFLKAETGIDQVAVLEMVPGGFEIDLSDRGLAERRSLGNSPNTWTPDFIEIEEDRLIFFGDLPSDTVEFTYRLKPLSRGRYTFAAPYAEAMYDIKKRFLGRSSQVTVH